MEDAEYDVLAQTEERLWWFLAQRRNIMAILNNADLPQAEHDCLDLGCGTGGMIRLIEKQHPDWRLVGVDLSSKALDYARQKSGTTFIAASGMDLPLEDNSCASVVSLDVLYHSAVEPKGFLAEIQRVLVKDGCVILSNPAYEWMRSYHDEQVHGVRRYTMKRIRKDLEDAGFRVDFLSYWNTILFPLMVIKRKILTGSGEKSDVHDIPGALNTVFDKLTLLEAFLLRHRVGMPYGGSVLAVGVKP